MPNSTLDPHGLQGSATAQRLRMSRHRRQLQTLLLAVSIILAIAALLWLAYQPRLAGFSVQSARALPFDSQAPATLDQNGNLWFATRGGALWQVAPTGRATLYGTTEAAAGAPPLVSASGGVYVAGLDGSLSAFNASGAPRWKQDLGVSSSTMPALWREGNDAVIGIGDNQGHFSGLDARDGVTRWTTDLKGPIGNAIIVTKNAFLAPTLARDAWRGGLVCADAQSGQIKWHFPRDSTLTAAGVAAPLFDEASNRVFWCDDENHAVCLDAQTGRALWQKSLAPLRAPSPDAVMLRAAPILARDNVYFGANDGSIRALNARNGQTVWRAVLSGPIDAIYAVESEGKAALLAVSARGRREHGEIALINAQSGAVIRRGAGERAWPMADKRSALVIGDEGKLQHLRWN